MNVHFLSKLIVTEAAEGIWRYYRPFYTVVLADGRRIEIIIPAGFYTDFCSVPRMPVAFVLYGGKGNRGGGIHDALYSPFTKIIVRDMDTGEPFEVTRKWADDVLAAALKTCGVGAFSRGMMWAGVRAFGWQFYKKPPLMEHGK